jgi:hypothetical protein
MLLALVHLSCLNFLEYAYFLYALLFTYDVTFEDSLALNQLDSLHLCYIKKCVQRT